MTFHLSPRSGVTGTAIAALALLLAAPALAGAAPDAARRSSPAVHALAKQGHRRHLGVLHYPKRRDTSHAAGRSRPPGPRGQVGAANAAARIEPDGAAFVNATQRYTWADGALFEVYAKPGRVTDIALEPGEQFVGSGPVAAGDTARWIIGDTVSGTGAAARVHILVKPVRADIATNMVINTDRRTYHLELRANLGVYMSAVAWTYPEDALIALRKTQADAVRAEPVASGIELSRLSFSYAIDGDKPAWRPLRVFDDGQHAYVEFPAGVAGGDLPPLFVIGPDGREELVNYRVAGHFMIVDRLFDRAELALGAGKHAVQVRIVATKGRGA